MKLKIDFDIPKISLENKWPSFYMMGSCFAESQSKRINRSGLPVDSNPFGIIYNPISIQKIIERITQKNYYTESDFIFFNEKFLCLEHHGSHSYLDISTAITESNTLLDTHHNVLKAASVIVITLGTSMVYTYKDNVVANCHKMPSHNFEHRHKNAGEIKQSIQELLQSIRTLNPKAHIVLTVSPIRHLRSGVQESSRSKATLLSVIYEILETESGSNASYFPAYEIMMDELRDYRFFKVDMMHPTDQAEEYVWERFATTYLATETHAIMKEAIAFRQFANHRPKQAAELHKRQIVEKRTELLNKHPFLQLE